MASFSEASDRALDQDAVARKVFLPLDRHARDIRLVRLLPAANRDSPLQCLLQVVSLLAQPVFEALSWCWGDISLTEVVELEHKPWTLRSNLAQALKYLRLTDKERLIWVDALSINQGSYREARQEKSEQIELMKYIFAEATTTRIWMGVPYPGLQEFLQTAFVESSGIPHAIQQKPEHSLGHMVNFLLLACRWTQCDSWSRVHC